MPLKKAKYGQMRAGKLNILPVAGKLNNRPGANYTGGMIYIVLVSVQSNARAQWELSGKLCRTVVTFA
ncbi:hypothetical protein SAMN02745146_0661 [Hymenobacter daecheongensis DSM 21074]|uniref:Uncharacterized protein n=1 Tax=Hymenobacter daecheongensis DSM 21074 TaxID=1121955 RepID=A0A1M6AJD2_9BACT|nr:hypothetical protein SAMN02745146_0661 [Hymenobacter daecheongensis DSM 21074]